MFLIYLEKRRVSLASRWLGIIDPSRSVMWVNLSAYVSNSWSHSDVPSGQQAILGRRGVQNKYVHQISSILLSSLTNFCTPNYSSHQLVQAISQITQWRTSSKRSHVSSPRVTSADGRARRIGTSAGHCTSATRGTTTANAPLSS